MSKHPLYLYNTRSRTKENFTPLIDDHVGMYVCGPTVYGEPHLGHARSAVTFDILFRYLRYLGYKVRYVRNITDVGHLENDADEGEDKIAKKARLESLEPMEIAQHYTREYHKSVGMLNCLSPSIEPTATGHIIEQITVIRKILEHGYAYEANGSVYFDVTRYNEDYPYGELSGRVLEELLENSRDLEGQDEKKSAVDFALWKKAKPEHIMRWPSPWSDGFPGWHLECTAMSTKYLGPHFDIHGGGMDLMFPHHEAEIAQNKGACGEDPCRFWVHNNMITINGQKMGKSLGNFITLNAFFSGEHEALDRPYGPMCIRFFILQAHYRSTADFSTEALTASEKGYFRLMEAVKVLDQLEADAETTGFDPEKWLKDCHQAMNDDLNTPVLIAHLFDAVRYINTVNDGKARISPSDLKLLREKMHVFITDVLGLLPVSDDETQDNGLSEKLVEAFLDLRRQSRAEKNFQMADQIRDMLNEMGVEIKDSKEGTTFKIKG